MARPDEDRDPAREEEAALVDDLVRQLRRAGPVAGSGPAKSGAAHFERPDVGSKPLTYSAPAAMGKVGIWTLVGLGALLGTALTQWPYGRACGWPLGFYLIAVATLVVTGWGSPISSHWARSSGVSPSRRRRSCRASATRERRPCGAAPRVARRRRARLHPQNAAPDNHGFLRGATRPASPFVEIEQQGGVIAQRVSRPASPSPPVIADVSEARLQLVIDEGLVDPKAIPAVWRVPRVGARQATQQPERVAPS